MLVDFLNGLSLPDPMKKRLFNDFSKEADGGNDAAYSSLMLCHHYGYGVERDDMKAIAICELLAKKDPNALYNLGWFLSSGDIKHDKVKAEEYFLEAAKKGHVEAMVHLGVIKIEQEDFPLAESWLIKAATSGNASANYNLGLIYHSTPLKNDEKAVECFQKAAEAGLGEAMFRLGKIYAHDANLADCTKATEWYNKAAEKGITGVPFELGLLYHDREDYVQSEIYLLKANEANHPEAPIQLGRLYSDMGKLPEAERWALQVTTDGASYFLGLLYIKMKNWKKAQAWFLRDVNINILSSKDDSPSMALKQLSKAAVGGDGEAQARIIRSNPQYAVKLLAKTKLDAPTAFTLGVLCEVGLSVRKDLKAAIKYYTLAAADNNLAACHLKRLYVSRFVIAFLHSFRI